MTARITVQLLLWLLLGFHLPCLAEDGGTGPGKNRQSPVEIEERIFQAVNGIRQKNGLKALRPSRKLQELARLHSLDMANFHYLGHIDSRREDLRKRAEGSNLKGWRVIAENVVRTAGYERHAEAMVKEWMNRSEHRENILNGAFDATGIGVVHECGGFYYATQVFMQTAR